MVQSNDLQDRRYLCISSCQNVVYSKKPMLIDQLQNEIVNIFQQFSIDLCKSLSACQVLSSQVHSI